MDNQQVAISNTPGNTEYIQTLIAEQVGLRNRRTPQRRQSKVDKGNKGFFTYVKGINALKWLEENFLIVEYIEHTDKINTTANWMSAPLTITVINQHNVKRSITRNGSVEAVAKDGKILISPIKAVFQDALKRCCVALGGFRDVYGEIDAEDNTSSEPDTIEDFDKEIMPLLIELLTAEQMTTNQLRILLNKYFSRELTFERIQELYKD